MTSNYKPPFSISDKTINLIAEISAQIERYAIRMEQDDGLLLRKINRIKTIQGSLAIEGNTLGTDQITDILEDKHVMGRLWQSLLLAKLHPVFEYLPVENMVFKNQQLYYKAINNSTSATNSGIFVEFMLGEILNTVKNRQGEPFDKTSNVGVNVGVNIELERIFELIKQFPGINAIQLAKQLPDRTKRTIERLLAVLKANNRIEFKGAPKSGGYYIKPELKS